MLIGAPGHRAWKWRFGIFPRLSEFLKLLKHKKP